METLDYMSAYPIATASAILVYVVLGSLAVPALRERITPLLTMPGSTQQNHVVGLDAMRGLAASVVALGHCVWLVAPTFNAAAAYAPFLGIAVKAVPVFCTISGFLIYRSLLNVSTLSDLRSYALRRFFRIYPVYVVSVILGLIMFQYAASPMSPGVGTSARFFADLFLFRVLWWPGFANPVAWSLYHEIAFYVVLPLVLLVVTRKHILLFCALALLAMLLGDYPSRDFGLWKYFLFGIAASELSDRLRPFALPAFLLALALFIADGFSYDWFAMAGLTAPKNFGDTFGLGLFCFFLLVSVPNLPKLFGWTEFSLFRIFGAMSYSVFLLHPFYIFANFPQMEHLIAINRDALAPLPGSTLFFWLVFFPGVYLWGMLGFILVEKPGIRIGRTIIRNKAEASTISTPTDASTGLAQASRETLT